MQFYKNMICTLCLCLILMDMLINIRDAMELVKNGLLSSMEYNAATMVASKRHARKVVLNHSTQSPLADLKEQVENSKYNDPGAFGEMPQSAYCFFYELLSRRAKRIIAYSRSAKKCLPFCCSHLRTPALITISECLF